MPQQNLKTHGFTLVEMAIVIVIIGLVMGMVTASRSYIRHAELNTIMNESKYYITQFNQFQTLYNAVPGDIARASTIWPKNSNGATTNNGDGNGIINADSAEVFYAFEHLADAGLIQGTYSGIGPNAKIGTNVPTGDVSGITYLFNHPSETDGAIESTNNDLFYQNGLYGHVLRVAAQPNTATGLPSTAFLTPKEAYEMDGKFDDGSPTTGWITVPKTLTTCFSGSAYDTGATNGGGINCWFILNIR